MSEITTIVDPVELTELARIAANDFDAQVATLSRFLPSRETADIRYGYNKADDFFVDPTPFRAYDAETPIGRRGGLQRITGEIPALGRKIPLSEYAQLRLRNASDSEVADQARKDAIQEARSIAARAEQARGELLTSGKVIIAENGFVSTYDSGRNAALTVTALAGTAKWTDTDDSVPLDNIETLAGLTKTHGGLKGNHVIFGEDAYTAFVNTDQVKSSALRMAVADLPVGSIDDVDAANLLTRRGYTMEKYEAPLGMASAPPIDSNQVIVVRRDALLGETLYGLTLESFEPEYSSLGSQAGIVAGSWKTRDPINAWVHVAAIMLPILGNPDLTASLQVVD